jgi:hypothetical protein
MDISGSIALAGGLPLPPTWTSETLHVQLCAVNTELECMQDE